MTQPIIQKKNKNFNFSVFTNKNQDGKTYYSIQLQRSYKNKDTDEWIRETINLFPDDLLKLSNLAANTYTAILENVSKEKGTPTYSTQEINDNIPF